MQKPAIVDFPFLLMELFHILISPGCTCILKLSFFALRKAVFVHFIYRTGAGISFNFIIISAIVVAGVLLLKEQLILK